MNSPEQHLDLDALADVLSGEASLGGTEHVAGCAQCRAALDELRAAQSQITEGLSALPAVTMPDDIAARLHNALRAEAPGAAGADTGVATTTVTPFPAAASRDDARRNPTRGLAAAAAVVVLLGGGIYGISRLRGDSGDSGGSPTAAGAKTAPEQAVARNSSGADYTDRATLAAAVPDLLAGRRQAADSATLNNAAAPSVAAAPQHGAITKAAPDPLAPLRATKGLAECLVALLPPDDPSVRPLAIDYATFRGQPAMVVLLPGTVANKLDIFVVGPGCSRADAHVLFYTSVDKP